MSGSSQSRDSLISVRLVVADHYQANPVNGLDPLVSDFTGYNIKKVPIIRVFGSTAAGQKACLNIHGIFPYIYVPFPSGENDGFVYRLAASLDKAINISMQQGKSNIQHVYKAVKVSGIPMYGYHPRQHTFVKIYFYNPFMVKRAAELLQGGGVMNKILQPHESHTNYVLQFMMDYNLQGMNLIHLSHALFRQGKLHDEFDDMEPIIEVPWKKKRHPSMNSSIVSNSDANVTISDAMTGYLKVPLHERLFEVEEMEDCMKMSAEVSRQSTSELELDAVAADIINHQDVSGAAMNPGLVSLWQDERTRRQHLGLDDPLTPPSSPPRSPRASEKSESEKFWFDRMCKVIENKIVNESNNEDDDDNDPDATMALEKKLRPHVYAVETSDHDVTLLPGATELETHIQSLSSDLSILNMTSSGRNMRKTSVSLEDVPGYLDETVVDEEFIMTQLTGNDASESDSDIDEELVDILADLAVDAKKDLEPPTDSDDIFKTPKSNKCSQNSQLSARKLSKYVSEALAEEEDAESLEMSQAVWETEGDWADLDRTLMENLAANLNDCDDMEDMFKK